MPGEPAGGPADRPLVNSWAEVGRAVVERCARYAHLMNSTVIRVGETAVLRVVSEW